MQLFTTLDTEPDEEILNIASAKINRLIKDELDQYPSLKENDIILGGISQGGALALYTGLTISEKPFGGIIALSTWLPLRQRFQKNSILVRNYFLRYYI